MEKTIPNLRVALVVAKNFRVQGYRSPTLTRGDLGNAMDMDLGFRGEDDDGDSGSESRNTMYPGSRLHGGGSLRPASNPVYDNICVTWICRRRSCVYLVFVAIYVFISYDLSKGYPCLALYTQSG
jgi:hypothetical protein